MKMIRSTKCDLKFATEAMCAELQRALRAHTGVCELFYPGGGGCGFKKVNKN